MAAVEINVADHVAHVRLNRPDKHNAIDGEMMHGLIDGAARLAADPSVRVVVLSGNGPSFCSGLDMANFADMASGDLSAGTESVQDAHADLSPGGANRAQQVGWAWHELPVPVLAALRGHVLGGGLNLALGADVRIVAPDATIGFVEVTWGLIPDMSATQSLRRLVGADRAKHLMWAVQRLTGTEALSWGLATEVHDDPLARATELAAHLAQLNPAAVRAIKAVVDDAIGMDSAAGLALEAERSSALLGSPDQVEAVMARLEDRSPEFAG